METYSTWLKIKLKYKRIHPSHASAYMDEIISEDASMSLMQALCESSNSMFEPYYEDATNYLIEASNNLRVISDTMGINLNEKIYGQTIMVNEDASKIYIKDQHDTIVVNAEEYLSDEIGRYMSKFGNKHLSENKQYFDMNEGNSNILSEGLTDAFYNAVKRGDVRSVRIMMKDSLLIDPTFKQFGEMEKAASGLKGLYEPHDGRGFNDQGAWNDDYMNREMVRTVNNFSHERINHLKQVVRKQRPAEEIANSMAEKGKNVNKEHKESFVKKVGEHISRNKGKYALGAAAVIGAGYLAHRALKKRNAKKREEEKAKNIHECMIDIFEENGQLYISDEDMDFLLEACDYDLNVNQIMENIENTLISEGLINSGETKVVNVEQDKKELKGDKISESSEESINENVLQNIGHTMAKSPFGKAGIKVGQAIVKNRQDESENIEAEAKKLYDIALSKFTPAIKYAVAHDEMFEDSILDRRGNVVTLFSISCQSIDGTKGKGYKVSSGEEYNNFINNDFVPDMKKLVNYLKSRTNYNVYLNYHDDSFSINIRTGKKLGKAKDRINESYIEEHDEILSEAFFDMFKKKPQKPSKFKALQYPLGFAIQQKKIFNDIITEWMEDAGTNTDIKLIEDNLRILKETIEKAKKGYEETLKKYNARDMNHLYELISQMEFDTEKEADNVCAELLDCSIDRFYMNAAGPWCGMIKYRIDQLKSGNITKQVFIYFSRTTNSFYLYADYDKLDKKESRGLVFQDYRQAEPILRKKFGITDDMNCIAFIEDRAVLILEKSFGELHKVLFRK